MTDLAVRLRSAYRRRERLWVALTLAAPVLLLAGLATMGWLEARGKVWFYGRLEHGLQQYARPSAILAHDAQCADAEQDGGGQHASRHYAATSAAAAPPCTLRLRAAAAEGRQG